MMDTKMRNTMKYKVHRFYIASIFPNVKPTLQGIGSTAKVDFVFVVEKTN